MPFYATCTFAIKYIDISFHSKLVPALVWIFPKSSTQHLEHGWKCFGPSRQRTLAALGGLRHHFTGNNKNDTQNVDFTFKLNLTIAVSTILTAVCVATAGNSVLWGPNSRWVASTFWQHFHQSPIISAYDLCGLYHMQSRASATVRSKTRLWGNLL